MEKMEDDWRSLLPEALVHYLNGRRIDEVECFVPDLVGIARGKAIPAKKFSLHNNSYMPISIFYISIAGTYTDNVDTEDGLTERDLRLIPDMETATAAPWTEEATMQVINDLHTIEGKPVGLAPRNVLKRVLAAYDQLGLEPIVAPEMEFYLTSPNVDPNDPIEPPIGRTGRKGIGRQAYSIVAVDEYGPVIDDIYNFAEAQGFGIDGITQEDGAGQIEINLQHGNPLRLADQVLYFKRSIREAALRNGCFATFMAKPMRNEPGSAMHIHQSILDKRTGQNIFSDEAGEPTDSFYHCIGGFQRYLPNALLLMAPYVNSYRRFDPESSAPSNFEWDTDNRLAGIRVPISRSNSRRIENRIIGMDSNPYLAIAANLACGLLGIRNKIEPRAKSSGLGALTPTDPSSMIPRSMNTALDLFSTDSEFAELLGHDFCQVYHGVKAYELNEFLNEISAWEREHLLLNV